MVTALLSRLRHQCTTLKSVEVHWVDEGSEAFLADSAPTAAVAVIPLTGGRPARPPTCGPGLVRIGR